MTTDITPVTSLTDRLGSGALPDARRAAGSASLDLHHACAAAGLSLSALPSIERPGQVEIGLVSPETAVTLTRMIRRTIKDALRASERLRAVFLARGLDMSDPYVRQGQIVLGEISLTAADRLTGLLGGPQPDPDTELSYWPEAQLLLARFCEAFKQATGGGFIDPEFHPDCLRCNAEALITLGSIPVVTARRLARALERPPEAA
ncbi:hypothetical protein [Streptomyces sp. MNP-20]|uniref:hypothetical protein n=1 Tax=Streptomyces sp. MNP-20 TaxID=2721165 RepID=UPI0015529E4E|nr:hypothetical protein [Streptomyces sp. MNP-20]